MIGCKRGYQFGLGVIVAVIIAVGLGACGEAESDRAPIVPIAFHDDDECHVCGMIIVEFEGPKGQAVEPERVRKFCSTAEMIGWWLQPENQTSGARLYVHDMRHGEWADPDDEHLVDATQAYYVVGTGLKSAMGATLASFADEDAAHALASEHGGTVLRFEQLDQQVLQRHHGEH